LHNGDDAEARLGSYAIDAIGYANSIRCNSCLYATDAIDAIDSIAAYMQISVDGVQWMACCPAAAGREDELEGRQCGSCIIEDVQETIVQQVICKRWCLSLAYLQNR
jgi:hypothetical protein